MRLKSICPRLLFSAIVLGLVGATPSFFHNTPDVVADSSSCYSSNSKACWKGGFNIYTDYEVRQPSTGVTRTYTLTITEIDNYVGADGQVKQKAMLINGQFPGPVLYADWGDRINVTVKNALRTNGTSMHWHGLRQLNNNQNDGVPGVTECPIAPGGSKTYSFLASQYGSSWYHSHISSQYGNGVTGSILINGPASADYDIDLGVFPIQDWYYPGIDNLFLRVNDPSNPFIQGLPGSPPASDNVFFNGSNVGPNGKGGKYAKINLTKGKKHRLRLINPSADNMFTVSVVGHQMTVIEVDFVPIKPYSTDSVFMGIGQRYDVLLEADCKGGAGNFWMNVTFSSSGACGTSNNPYPAAIVHYSDAKDELPTDRGTAPPDAKCLDSLETLTPIVTREVPRTIFASSVGNELGVQIVPDFDKHQVLWTMNSSAVNLTWEHPTLQSVAEGTKSFTSRENVLNLPTQDQWSFWLIQNLSPIPHPMHLHGHDFVVLGHSDSPANPFDPSLKPTTFDAAKDGPKLAFSNPPRRDSTVLPSLGWLAVAFQTGNPGSWLFHCHVVWHAAQGLSVQFLEKPDDLRKGIDKKALDDQCNSWRAYIPTDTFKKLDSGI